MKPAKDIKKYFQKSTLSTNPNKHEVVFEKIASAHEQSNNQKPEFSRISLGRIIMKSPLTKFAAAVIVIIVIIAGITIFNKTSSFALADILNQIEKISTYMYQMDMTLSGQQAMSKMPAEQKIHGSVFVSRQYGMKMTLETSNTDTNDVMVQETYMLPKYNIVIAIMPSQKSYSRLELDNTYIEQMKKQYYDPSVMVKQILDCKYQNLGRSTINGVEVEGFGTTDPNYQGGMYSLANVDVKLWVDVKTELPVQMEMNLLMKEQTGYNILGIVHNFQWNIPVKATDFEPNIPSDYKNISTNVGMPSITEETAIKGLKLFMDLTGKFPEKVTPETLQPEVAKLKDAQDNLKDQSQNPQEEANFKILKNMDVSKTIQGLALFYIFLNQDKKDPAYYGDIVTPEDVDKVLMRWKISDNEYRVIFGSLYAETVTADVLAELEKNLPK